MTVELTVEQRRAILTAGAVAVTLIATVLFPSAVPLGVVLQGALLGSLTGLLSLGLVLIYKTTKVVNFAYGAMGGVPAAAAATLYLSHGWPWPAAVALALVLGAIVGVVVERLVVHRFANTPRLVLTVATIGLAQILAGIELFEPRWLHGPTLITSFDTGLSRLHFTIGPVLFTGNDLLLVGAVPLVVISLSWFLLRTDAGTAVRAIAENRDRARLLGVPASRLSLVVWGLGGALAGLAVLLQAPSQGIPLDAAAGPAILLAPLAAAIVAGMETLWLAFAAGVGLGVLDQVVRWNVNKNAVEDAVFLVVILAALALQRRKQSRAEASDESAWSAGDTLTAIPAALRSLPEVRLTKAVLGVVIAAVALVAVPVLATPSLLDRMSVGIVFGLAALSLVVLTGWGGAVSLGQIALVGVGGVVAGDLIVHLNLDLFLSLFAAALAGGALALLIGLPALRVRGLFLSVTTLAFAVAVDLFFFNPANFSWLLPKGVIRPVLWKRFNLHREVVLYLLCLGLLTLAAVAVRGVRKARTGRAVIAARDNVRAAEAAAVPTTRARLGAFVLSGMIAGVGGGLYVVLLGGVGFHTFQASDSILVFSMTVIGGLSSISGALCGVALIQTAGVVLPRLQLIITGTGLLFVLMVFPAGIGGALQQLRDRLLRVVARRRGITVSVWMEDSGNVTAPDTASPAALPPVPAGKGGDGGEYLLRCEGLNASYGTLQVLFGVDLAVSEAEIVALLGTNGAGKSTVLKAVTGLLPPSGGRVTFGGEDVSRRSTERIATSGLTLMPGGRGIFPTLTVEENLRVAAWRLRRNRAGAAAARERSAAMFPILGQRAHTQAGNLSGGEQQMLSLAMAFLVKPRLLCIDELSLGLAPTIVATLVDAVKEIHRQGTTVVVVEQSVNVALLLAERAVFLEKGQVRYSGPTAQLLDRPDLLRAVFIGATASNGHRPSPPASSVAATSAAGLLECRQLTKNFGGVRAVDGVDLTVAPGEIVGLLGHNGAGKTTLFDLISGYLPLDRGQVLLGGRDVTAWAPHRRAVQALGRSFQEARLFPTLTVAETIAVALERHLANRDPLAAALRLPASTDTEFAVGQRVDALVELLGLGVYRDRLTGELSTGTRRIVELACMLAHEPAILLLDEPSAGIAQRETEALGPLLERVRQVTGCSLVIIEHDMALLTSLCHRLVALELGAVIADGEPAAVLDHPGVIASYLGTDEMTIHRSGSRRRAARVRS